jgi:hypothetical protein
MKSGIYFKHGGCGFIRTLWYAIDQRPRIPHRYIRATTLF